MSMKPTAYYLERVAKFANLFQEAENEAECYAYTSNGSLTLQSDGVVIGEMSYDEDNGWEFDFSRFGEDATE